MTPSLRSSSTDNSMARHCRFSTDALPLHITEATIGEPPPGRTGTPIPHWDDLRIREPTPRSPIFQLSHTACDLPQQLKAGGRRMQLRAKGLAPCGSSQSNRNRPRKLPRLANSVMLDPPA